jgi:phosphoesterase family protein
MKQLKEGVRVWTVTISAIVVILAAFAAAGTLREQRANGHLGEALATPFVRSHVSAPFSAALKGTAPGIGVSQGDALYVGVVENGPNAAPSVKDSSGDTFTQKGTAGVAKQVTTTLFEADNIVGSAAAQVTVALTVAQNFSVDVVDVNAAGISPDDAVGAAAYGSSGTGAQPKVTTTVAGDLVLGFIGDNENAPVTGLSGSTSVNSSTAASVITAGVVSQTDPGTGSFTIWGYMGPAATVYSISFAIAVKPLVVSTAHYAVAFLSTGLPTGTSWSVTLGGVLTTGLVPASLSFSELNGTYPYSVGSVPGYVASPSTGSLTVNGAPLSTTIAFALAPPPPKHFIDHVVVIVLENSNLSQVQAWAPYEQWLTKTYAPATNYYSMCHTSLPDYVTLASGYNNCVLGGNTAGEGNLADLLEKNGLTWAQYSESLPAPCTTTSVGLYDTNHNPFVRFSDIATNTTRCTSHLLGSATFNASVAAGSLQNYTFYTPNLDDDGHNTSILFADTWLKGFLSPILNGTGNYSSAASRNLVAHTAFLVTWDEGPATDFHGYLVDGLANSYCSTNASKTLSACGGQVYMVAVSPYSVGLAYSANATHVNLVSTVEWLFSLPSDGGWDGTSYFPAMASLFSFASNGFTHTE